MLLSAFETMPAITFAIVVLSWIAYAMVFITRKPTPKTPDQKRETGSITGFVLQGISYAIIWGIHRPYSTPLFRSYAVELALNAMTIAVAVFSVLFTRTAVKTLGKEWSVTARVLEGHTLATKGPYARVRHPIYTGMLGMLLATGFATSYWLAIALATGVFLIGTIIRVRHEERLLRETFGSEFESYSKEVPAIIPGFY